MFTTPIPTELQHVVAQRADGLCEFCLIAEADTYLGCEVDHTISKKHGGSSDSCNLASACVFCNQTNGSDIGSIYWESGEFPKEAVKRRMIAN